MHVLVLTLRVRAQPRGATIKLDPLDYHIIELLQEDGRMSSADVARRIGGVSDRTVRYRIDRLIRSGAIHVGAIVNPRFVGYDVIADVWIETVANRLSQVAAHLAELEKVSYVAYSTGDRNLSAQVYAPSNEELHEFVNEVVARIPGVARVRTMVVPRKIKDVHQWRVPSAATQRENPSHKEE
ncbi:MAG: Lrp/AsnC family transcriptional regulator [Thermoleophilia bacterium]